MLAQDLRQSIVDLLPRLRVFARALARAPDDADDLVQATCVKALSALGSFRPGTRLDSWLFRIMRNHFIDGYRQLRPLAPMDDAQEFPGQDGRAVLQARLELGEVAAIVARLPEEQRSVLLLVCVEGLSYRDTAEILDVPIGTVMSRLSRARLAVAEAVDGGMSSAVAEVKR